MVGLATFYKNEKSFGAEYFYYRFNKFVCIWNEKMNQSLEFREVLRVNSGKEDPMNKFDVANKY